MEIDKLKNRSESRYNMQKIMIKRKIEELLSKEFYCSSEDLNGKATVFSVNSNAKQPYLKILAYRNCVVVCTSKDIHYKVRDLLQHRNRDEIFEFPFVYGQTIHYVPDGSGTGDVLVASDYELSTMIWLKIYHQNL